MLMASTRSTRWFNLFFPSKPPPERHSLDNVPAALLPPELLLEIFYHAAQSSRAPDRDTVVYPTLHEQERSSRHPLVGALLTCSSWTGPATVALYEQIGTYVPLAAYPIGTINNNIQYLKTCRLFKLPNASIQPSPKARPRSTSQTSSKS